MSYAGHVFDMINRIKQNRDLIMSRREKIANLRERYLELTPYEKRDFYEKKIPREELKRIKADFRKKIIKERRRGIFLSILFTSIVIIAVIILVDYFQS